jgi:hypothetical protein
MENGEKLAIEIEIEIVMNWADELRRRVVVQ